MTQEKPISQETYNHAVKMWIFFIIGALVLIFSGSFSYFWIATINPSSTVSLDKKVGQAEHVELILRYFGCLFFALGLSEKIIFELKLMQERK